MTLAIREFEGRYSIRPTFHTSGEWDDEVDFKAWVDESTLLRCWAIRHHTLGHWCGYVQVPDNHPNIGGHWSDFDDYEVHGGVTFADYINAVIDNRPLEGYSLPVQLFAIGFDCAHAFDLAPAMDTSPIANQTYRTLDFVVQNCASLAQQLITIPMSL